jgi:hypothetical protein
MLFAICSISVSLTDGWTGNDNTCLAHHSVEDNGDVVVLSNDDADDVEGATTLNSRK